MSRLPLKERSPKPVVAMTKTIQAAVFEIVSSYLGSGAFQHPGTIGAERENPVQKFFRDHIPGKFSVCRGEVVDLFEKHSPQLDVVIFNNHSNCAFVSGDSLLLPAEALLVSIEVKTLLSKEEIEKSLNAANKLRELKPFRKPLSSVRTKGRPANKQCRYFHCVFAYDSDLATNDWLRSEHERVTSVSKSLGVPTTQIDRLYVINRGLLNFGPNYDMGVVEDSNSGKALTRLYMDVLNFLIREDARRKPAPYIDYAGKMTKDWVKL